MKIKDIYYHQLGSLMCQSVSNTLPTFINPSVTGRVKVSQNVDILANVHVYLVHLKFEHCQTIEQGPEGVASTKTSKIL